ncbi:hypothetical protein PAXINDRAFT_104025, partial [Paxillus involutus ATCC 200175]
AQGTPRVYIRSYAALDDIQQHTGHDCHALTYEFVEHLSKLYLEFCPLIAR